ncbi:MAG: mechanosensitive ion channel [Sulfurimonas sp.]|nr:mechanosensitive ion channel [Sulfurimonas sp.]
MKNIIFFLLLVSSLVAANSIKDKQQTRVELEKEDIKKEKIAEFIAELESIEEKIANKNSVWINSYASYLTSLDVRESLEKIKKRINYLRRIRKSLTQKDELNALISREKILTSQIEKIKKKDSSPFSDLLTPPNIDEIPALTNPFDIFTGFSLIKTLNKDYNDYILRKEELASIISLLRKEVIIYKEIEELDTKKKYQAQAQSKIKQLDRLESAVDTMSATVDVYQSRLDIVKAEINKDINVQFMKMAKIGVIILIVFIIFFLLKLFIKRYITDNERFYMANKTITFANVTLVIIILLVNYIENIGYLVTILGFASAGIAIAMKDWFMSILGWLVIVFGGSIHVGDRIRVDMDGMKYVGDVMDISLFRMTLLEDITLTTVLDNRRAGRIIFVPNNYVFTRMIANYTHSSLKTVWDGVDITITYDSNHKKAMHITKEITKKFSKGYTDITRKQLNKLRNNYSLKNTNVEPRIFSFIETNGINISSWYLTNAYATLTLRSVISTEIVDAFMKEDDITIAYPTQMLHMEASAKKKPPFIIDKEIV